MFDVFVFYFDEFGDFLTFLKTLSVLIVFDCFICFYFFLSIYCFFGLRVNSLIFRNVRCCSSLKMQTTNSFDGFESLGVCLNAYS